MARLKWLFMRLRVALSSWVSKPHRRFQSYGVSLRMTRPQLKDWAVNAVDQMNQMARLIETQDELILEYADRETQLRKENVNAAERIAELETLLNTHRKDGMK